MKKNTRAYTMTARAAKAEATRQRIRQSAMQLYCSRPVEEFTLEYVAQRAGTTVQTILRIFGSKDELIYAALEEMVAGGAFLKPSRPGDIKAAVTAFFDIYEGIGDLVMQRLNEERRRPALKAVLEQGRENHRDGVRTTFAMQLERVHGAARAQLVHRAHRHHRRLRLEAVAARHGARPLRRRGNRAQDDFGRHRRGEHRWHGYFG